MQLFFHVMQIKTWKLSLTINVFFRVTSHSQAKSPQVWKKVCSSFTSNLLGQSSSCFLVILQLDIQIYLNPPTTFDKFARHFLSHLPCTKVKIVCPLQKYAFKHYCNGGMGLYCLHWESVPMIFVWVYRLTVQIQRWCNSLWEGRLQVLHLFLSTLIPFL